MMYKRVGGLSRLLRFTHRGNPVPREQSHELLRLAMLRAKETGGQGAIAFATTGHETNEANWAFFELARRHFPEARLFVADGNDPGAFAYHDDILVSADKNPNLKGAQLIGEHFGAAVGTGVLAAALASGEIKVLVVLGGDLLGRLGREDFDLLVMIGSYESRTSKGAEYVLPAAAHLEQDGTFVNANGRVQRLRRAIPALGDSVPAYRLLHEMAAAWGNPTETQIASVVFKKIADAIPAFRGMTYETVGDCRPGPRGSHGDRRRSLGPTFALRDEMPWLELVLIVVKFLFTMVFILQILPLLIWAERKGAAYIQDRPGPNRASLWVPHPRDVPKLFGAWRNGTLHTFQWTPIVEIRAAGFLHTIVDVFKLITKEDVVPDHVERALWAAAPVLAMTISLVTLMVVPWGDYLQIGDQRILLQVSQLDGGILYVLAMTSLAVYAIMLAGWASNNKFSLLGGLRSSAQMVSYELAMGLSVACMFLFYGTTRLDKIVDACRRAPRTSRASISTCSRRGASSPCRGSSRSCCSGSRRWRSATARPSTSPRAKPSSSPATTPSTARCASRSSSWPSTRT